MASRGTKVGDKQKQWTLQLWQDKDIPRQDPFDF